MSDDIDMIWVEACAAALAGIPRMGPKRLAELLADCTPDVAWDLLGSNAELPPSLMKRLKDDPPEHRKMWAQRVRSIDPLDVLDKYRALDIAVWTSYTKYPARLIHDDDAPAVLFAQGNRNALDRPTVAIIGTRRCTQEGRNVARRFGRELAEAGVAVLSGLALGIDGAAHVGALEAAYGAPPIAVVGNGLDTVYPKRHAELWGDIREKGLIIAEAPLGAIPEPWRFPARNRILAGLADLLLVVESHEHGGSLITVRDAIERGRTVMAVPGSVQKPASVGTNRLFFDGAMPALCTDDVLMALEHEVRVTGAGRLPEPVIDDEVETDVLDALDWEVTSTDEVMLRTGRSLGEVAAALTRLCQRGWVTGASGYWQRASPEWR